MPHKTALFRSILIAILILSFTISAVSAETIIHPTTQTRTELALDEAFAYLASQMNADGGLRWTEDVSDVAVTLRVVLALAADYRSQHYLKSANDLTPIDFLSAEGVAWAADSDEPNSSWQISRVGQLLTAVAAANRNPRQFGPNSVNLIEAIGSSYDAATGVFGKAAPENVTDQVWAILGLAANHQPIPEEASAWLAAAQLKDGSFNDGFGSYLDTTPLTILALVASGYAIDDPAVDAAIAFMKTNQLPEGGWQTQWDTTTNVNITAAMLQVISAVDQLPMDANWQKHKGNPYDAVLSLQQTGGVIGADYANAFSTADAIIGLSGNTLTQIGLIPRLNAGFNFLVTSQSTTGGWGSPGQTIDTILAIRAAGWQPATFSQSSKSPMDELERIVAESLGEGPDSLGKTIIGVSAAGGQPTNFAGRDLPALLMATFDPAIGAFGDANNTWHQALGILGLYSAGVVAPSEAVTTLLGLQQEDGGWAYAPGFDSWADNTALSIQALLAAGLPPDSESIQKALSYLKSTQQYDGGWGDASTTAYALMALNALQIASDEWQTGSGQTASGHTPATNLQSYQRSDGSFVLSWENPDDNLMASASALLALMGGDYIVESASPDLTPRAALIIASGMGSPEQVCVTWDGSEINGMDLLDQSTLSYVSDGGFITTIEGVANTDGATNYWSYWTWDGRQWLFSNVGASATMVLPGSVHGWVFTSWEVFPSPPPAFTPDYHDICGDTALRNYIAQPYLSYTNSAQPSNPIVIATAPLPPSSEATSPDHLDPTESTNAEHIGEDQTDPAPSSLPLWIIGVFGLLIATVLFILYKRQKVA